MLRKLGPTVIRFARRSGLVRSGSVRKAVFGIVGLLAPNRVRVEVGDDAELEVDPGNPAELLYLLDYSSHEAGVREAIREHLDGGDTFLDVGAFVGYYTLVGCEAVADGQVVAFEPFPAYSERVVENVSANGCEARVETVALTDRTGESSITGSGSPTLQEEGDVAVETTTLDEYVADAGLESVDVVKIDVEGAEGALLAGATRTLTEFGPTLVMELHPEKLADRSSSVADVVDELRSFGYVVETLPGRNRVDGTDFFDGDGPGWLESNPHVLAQKEVES